MDIIIICTMMRKEDSSKVQQIHPIWKIDVEHSFEFTEYRRRP